MVGVSLRRQSPVLAEAMRLGVSGILSIPPDPNDLLQDHRNDVPRESSVHGTTIEQIFPIQTQAVPTGPSGYGASPQNSGDLLALPRHD